MRINFANSLEEIQRNKPNRWWYTPFGLQNGITERERELLPTQFSGQSLN